MKYVILKECQWRICMVRHYNKSISSEAPTLTCSDMLEMNLHNSDSANQGGGDYSADNKWTFAINIKET